MKAMLNYMGGGTEIWIQLEPETLHEVAQIVDIFNHPWAKERPTQFNILRKMTGVSASTVELRVHLVPPKSRTLSPEVKSEMDASE